jgi:hypothetical protein
LKTTVAIPLILTPILAVANYQSSAAIESILLALGVGMFGFAITYVSASNHLNGPLRDLARLSNDVADAAREFAKQMNRAEDARARVLPARENYQRLLAARDRAVAKAARADFERRQRAETMASLQRLMQDLGVKPVQGTNLPAASSAVVLSQFAKPTESTYRTIVETTASASGEPVDDSALFALKLITFTNYSNRSKSK